MLRKLGAETREIRLPEQLDNIDGLVIPGGESTTMGKLMVAYGFVDKLKQVARSGMPIFGTCAGMIVLARDTVQGYDQALLGVMDIVVHRNGFGRQIDSFETDLDVKALGQPPFRAVFIRAPYIERSGPEVEVLASLPDGRIVSARQDNLLTSAFHPELTDDPRMHRYFLEIVNASSHRLAAVP
jgi:5'-phosphate synthase pdxT subunit